MSKGVPVRVRPKVQCSRGEIGRRAGLKILSFGVWVQVPPGVQKKKMKINLVVTKTCFIFDPQMNNTIHIQPVMKNTRRADEGLRLEVAMYNCFMR